MFRVPHRVGPMSVFGFSRACVRPLGGAPTAGPCRPDTTQQLQQVTRQVGLMKYVQHQIYFYNTYMKPLQHMFENS